MSPRYPSRLSSTLPEQDGSDTRAWLARVVTEIERWPLGESAPCANPECAGPVDYQAVPKGDAPRYCSRLCSNRAADLRRRARQQIETIERLLAATKGRQQIPRDLLNARARHLRWWLAYLDGPKSPSE